MGDCLCVRSDSIVVLGRKIDMLGTEAGENVLDFTKGFLGGAVLDKDQGLGLGVDFGPV